MFYQKTVRIHGWFVCIASTGSSIDVICAPPYEDNICFTVAIKDVIDQPLSYNSFFNDGLELNGSYSNNYQVILPDGLKFEVKDIKSSETDDGFLFRLTKK